MPFAFKPEIMDKNERERFFGTPCLVRCGLVVILNMDSCGKLLLSQTKLPSGAQIIDDLWIHHDLWMGYHDYDG